MVSRNKKNAIRLIPGSHKEWEDEDALLFMNRATAYDVTFILDQKC